MQRLLDPRLETFFFLLAERAPQFRRWHDFIHILAVDANKEFTRVALLRSMMASQRRPALGCGFLIQPQIALAGLGVGTMALKALIREDGENILVDGFLWRSQPLGPKGQSMTGYSHQKRARQGQMERPIVGLKCICCWLFVRAAYGKPQVMKPSPARGLLDLRRRSAMNAGRGVSLSMERRQRNDVTPGLE